DYRMVLKPRLLAAVVTLLFLLYAFGWATLDLFQPTSQPAGIPSESRHAPLSLEHERALKPKDTFKECVMCPEMVVIPAGSFLMGSPIGEPWRVTDEGPQHTVNFARPFAVGRFAVTFDEWEACVADRGCRGYWPGDKGWGRGRRPVINISYEDARA